MLCAVLGVPGVGKTTVLNSAMKYADISLINFGDYMLAEARKEKLVNDRDEIRKLPKKMQIALQQKAAEKINSDSKGGNVVVDTHAAIKTPLGYMPGLPETVLRALNPDTFILIEADVNEVCKRRGKDASRNRDFDSPQKMEEHQAINRCFAIACAEIADATIVIVKNEHGNIDAAGKRIAKIFQ